CLWLKGTGWSARWPCRVTHGERCNWSSVTPRAMTINPVNTRLMRASALELRSKICAMNDSWFDFRWHAIACISGHMVGVQETLFERTVLRTGKPEISI